MVVKFLYSAVRDSENVKVTVKQKHIPEHTHALTRARGERERAEDIKI